MERAYIAIDMKSFYASVECVARGLDPLKAKLLVADPTRSDQTICLAVSPALKAIGVPGRPRLFEAKQAVFNYEMRTHRIVDYIIATPRMAEYERVSAQIYSIFLHYAAPEDIHVYSIDESFIDCTRYLHIYEEEAARTGKHPAHVMAMTMIREVLSVTGITATVGIGTNMYLAKVAMDIVAKKAKPDRDGVRIAELNEDSYKYLLWDHTPLTDFWQVGMGKSARLENAGLHTMGDVARFSVENEEWFYKEFGIDGEIMIDHAWGIEPVTMYDIKHYRTDNHSLSNGQVLPRPYKYDEARIVFSEMIDILSTDMFAKNLVSDIFTWWVSYDFRSLEYCPQYSGAVCMDFYGRLHPKHSNGTVRTMEKTNLSRFITEVMLPDFDRKTDHRLLFRKLGVCAADVTADEGFFQLDFFTDYDKMDKERRLQGAMQAVRAKFGNNAVLHGMNYLQGATTRERNTQIGGHRA
ncbi:MAG: DNA methylase [Ruminiclostridium sp.]|nr:DNA methylase [Ruminiclostridium sp.]